MDYTFEVLKKLKDLNFTSGWPGQKKSGGAIHCNNLQNGAANRIITKCLLKKY
jgi:hypothetical protein